MSLAMPATAQSMRLVAKGCDQLLDTPGNLVTYDSLQYQYSGSNGSVWSETSFMHSCKADTMTHYRQDNDSVLHILSKDAYSYDGSGRLFVHLQQRYYHDTIYSQLFNSSFYNINGLLSRNVAYVKNSIAVIQKSVDYTYTNNGQPANQVIITFNYTTGAAQYVDSIAYHYTAALLPDSISDYKRPYYSNTYSGLNLETHAYSVDGRDTFMASSWGNNMDSLFTGYRSFYYYDAAGNRNYVANQIYSVITHDYGLDNAEYLTYDASNQLTTDSLAGYNYDSSYADGSCISYTYTGNDVTYVINAHYFTATQPQYAYGTAYHYIAPHIPDTRIYYGETYDAGTNSFIQGPTWGDSVVTRYYYEPVPTAGIAALPAFKGIKVWPVPASDHLVISLDGNEYKDARLVELYTVNGVRVLAQPLTGTYTTLLVGALPTGSYLLRVSGTGKQYSQMVQKL